jgi:hypothetical protein
MAGPEVRPTCSSLCYDVLVWEAGLNSQPPLFTTPTYIITRNPAKMLNPGEEKP